MTLIHDLFNSFEWFLTYRRIENNRHRKRIKPLEFCFEIPAKRFFLMGLQNFTENIPVDVIKHDGSGAKD